MKRLNCFVGRTLLPDVDISLCGGLEGDNPTFSTVLFEQSKISFDDFVLHLQVTTPVFLGDRVMILKNVRFY
jgi:hypothetical protein